MRRAFLLIGVVLAVMASFVWMLQRPTADGDSAASASVEPVAGDNGRQKLYVLSSAGNDITVIDVEKTKAIRSVQVGQQPWGVVVQPDMGQ